MIPRHRPPFGIFGLAKALLPGSDPCCVAQLEQAYAEALCVPHAVWLPSARYGICHTLALGLSPQDQVYCPAFTCGVVHQAIRYSTHALTYVDTNPDDFLMDRQFLNRPVRMVHQSQQSATQHSTGNTPAYGAVLSEVFGYRYRAPEKHPFLRDARLRIFDMAMCISTVEDMQRLTASDVALISFGLGKSLYAGWGGMAFTRDPQMAAALRTKRDQDLRLDAGVVQLRQVTAVCLRTLAHSAWLYKFCRQAAERRSSASAARLASQGQATNQQAAEWSRGPTGFHLKLAGQNLRRSVVFRQERVECSRIYRSELSQLADTGTELETPWLTFLPDNADAMSHFCIRVSPSVRDSLREYLWNKGFDTATLFPFPKEADAAHLRNTWQLTQQIIGLPLSGNLSRQRVHRLCSAIKDFAATRSAEWQVAEPRAQHKRPVAA
ncbi:MAG: hypothetical protein KDB01_10655 [Planctomycetaceae bacterium]|nr:hypothetical protein [Planctomycetaceae bacterium]